MLWFIFSKLGTDPFRFQPEVAWGLVVGPSDTTWAEGQERPTFIYRHTLRFSPRNP